MNEKIERDGTKPMPCGERIAWPSHRRGEGSELRAVAREAHERVCAVCREARAQRVAERTAAVTAAAAAREAEARSAARRQRRNCVHQWEIISHEEMRCRICGAVRFYGGAES